MWGSCLLLAVLAVFCSAEDLPLGQTRLGKVSGIWRTSARSGWRFAAFESVPFAKPPIKELRFQAPQPLEKKWDAVYNSTNSMPLCMQKNMMASGSADLIGTEDCLYLSVFTRNVTGRAPVLAYFHGGAFVVGGAKQSEPDYLMDEDIVVVRSNYRLGIMGFLSFEDSVLPGNQGMKDQVMALKWIKDNIAGFGGDPTKVTIIGESAGGASVFHHTISPLTDGLFQGVIAESGSSYATWAVSAPGQARSEGKELFKALNCSENSKIGLPCVLNKTAEEITRKWLTFNRLVTPVLEKPGSGAYLVGPPRKWKHKNVPILMGVTTAEGLAMTYNFVKDSSQFKNFTNNLDQALPRYLYYQKTSSSPSNVTKIIKDYYFPKGNISMDDWINITTIFTDALFTIPAIDGAYNHTGDVYFYLFDYILKELTPNLPDKLIFGSSHCTESHFIWRRVNPTTKQDMITRSTDIELSRKLVKIVGSFVKNRAPSLEGNVPWPKWTSLHPNYIFFNRTGFFEKKEGLVEERYRLWKNMPYRDMYDMESLAPSNRISSILILLVAVFTYVTL